MELISIFVVSHVYKGVVTHATSELGRALRTSHWNLIWPLIPGSLHNPVNRGRVARKCQALATLGQSTQTHCQLTTEAWPATTSRSRNHKTLPPYFEWPRNPIAKRIVELLSSTSSFFLRPAPARSQMRHPIRIEITGPATSHLFMEATPFISRTIVLRHFLRHAYARRHLDELREKFLIKIPGNLYDCPGIESR